MELLGTTVLHETAVCRMSLTTDLGLTRHYPQTRGSEESTLAYWTQVHATAFIKQHGSKECWHRMQSRLRSSNSCETESPFVSSGEHLQLAPSSEMSG